MLTMAIAGLVLFTPAHHCKRCGFDTVGVRYPAYSAKLNKAITYTAKRMHIKLSKTERSCIHKLVRVENPEGNVHLREPRTGAYGIFQGLKGTYKEVGIPYGTRCISCQLQGMILYVRYRRSYRNFARAWRHWQRHRWY